MRATLSDWKNGWFGVELAIAPSELDALIAQLQRLKSDHEQHFHISSDYKAEGGIGDIEVCVELKAQAGGLRVSSVALSPGDEVGGNV